MENLNCLLANWHAPAQVNALTTLRTPGVSKYPFDQNNLALHVNDDKIHVQLNRNQLKSNCGFSQEPVWLNQMHTNRCILAEEETERDADAAVTRQKDLPLAILTADCLPILLCNQAGDEIAAIHAGWRGLGNQVIENTINKMDSHPSELLAWIGPSICPTCFQVGEEVLQYFQENDYGFSQETFIKKGNHWYANLQILAEEILQYLGIKKVYQSNACTFEKESSFYSYRRNSRTGRMVTLIWINSQLPENS